MVEIGRFPAISANVLSIHCFSELTQEMGCVWRATSFVKAQLADPTTKRMTKEEAEEFAALCCDGRFGRRESRGGLSVHLGGSGGLLIRMINIYPSLVARRREASTVAAITLSVSRAVQHFQALAPLCIHSAKKGHGVLKCGYLEHIRRNPELYGVYHPLLLEKVNRVLHRYRRPVDNTVELTGEHIERGVLIIHFVDDILWRILPTYHLGDEDVQYFVVMPEMEERLCCRTAPGMLDFFNEVTGEHVKLDVFMRGLGAMIRRHTPIALKAVANKKPVIELWISANGTIVKAHKK